ncbi:uncharacterized protein LOC135847730 isoform X3 [Planococcus citri]|uniref:uncharacterized protein LOC135847730 isoform X3 n=1 Tax=Planococcus citri TaxID=170843 RepID=UPI0031F962EB
MAADTSNVYDVMHPTPVSLQELSVIAVSLTLWRSEIIENRKSQTLERFWTSILVNNGSISSLRTKLPELPSVIYDVIVEYVTRLGRSIVYCVGEHNRTVLYFKKRHFPFRLSEVLEYFDDFVCDYNGTVDFVKTAERMMHCDGLDDVLKFVIACRYFLEDHVRRIWPSVREKMNLRNIGFHSLRSVDLSRYPMLDYWICNLSNQLNKMPLDQYDTIDEEMLEECIHWAGNPLAINYFWNRVPCENQMQMAIELIRVKKKECFVRCILSKLDDQQLEEFVSKKGSDLMQALLEDHSRDERFIIRPWTYIKNLMNGDTFYDLVVNMLRTEAGYFLHIVRDHRKLENWLHQCCLIWNSAHHLLKRSAIIDISSDLELIICRNDYNRPTRGTSSEFLLFILSDFTSEEKQSFWRNCWKNLMIHKNTRDLQRIMEVCFEHEDDMIEFKENVIAKSENFQLRCVSSLSRLNFNEVDALINFGCPRSAETAKHVKQASLWSSFIGKSLVFYRKLVLHFHCEEFNTFINNAYDSVDLANDFKHQLVSSLDNLRAMSGSFLVEEHHAEAAMKFIETFVSTEQILQQIKSFILDCLKEEGIRGSFTIKYASSEPFFDQVLLWCLGSYEQVMEFRQTYIKPGDEYRFRY